MPKNRKERDRQQIENTIDNLHEARETLMNEAVPEEEKKRIREKNRHREEQIASLKEELEEE
ncbi:MAG: small acid-soluble spore protein Tlp [Firmicutes bacterium]|nr:small acid-soluble spore protein Tlp [Bacillota bacterium]